MDGRRKRGMPGGMNGHGNEAKYLEEATEDGTERGKGIEKGCPPVLESAVVSLPAAAVELCLAIFVLQVVVRGHGDGRREEHKGESRTSARAN
eukprot:3763852-Rhodomonas_salina.5